MQMHPKLELWETPPPSPGLQVTLIGEAKCPGLPRVSFQGVKLACATLLAEAMVLCGELCWHWGHGPRLTLLFLCKAWHRTLGCRGRPDCQESLLACELWPLPNAHEETK